MKNNLIIGVILALIIGGGIGFFAGMQFEKSQTPNMAMNNGGNFQQGPRDGSRQFPGGSAAPNSNFRPTNGEIISADESSITVKTSDGSSKIILITNNTSINKATEVSIDELKVGETVMVVGETNSDGSQTASTIQLNPQMRGFEGNDPAAEE